MAAPEAGRQLYLFGGPADPGAGADPLDPLAALMTRLGEARDVVDARVCAGVSLRAVARTFRAGVDEALYDLTDPAVAAALRPAALAAPGAALLSAHRPVERVGGRVGRSWAVPSSLDLFVLRPETAVGVDAAPPVAGATIARPGLAPGFDFGAGGEESSVAIFGDVGGLYEALLALREKAEADRVVLVAPTTEAAAAVGRYARWLGLDGTAMAMAAEGRAARARVAMAAEWVIDVASAGWPGATDPVAAARLAGRGAARLDAQAGDLVERIGEVLSTPTQARPAPTPTVDTVEAAVRTILAATSAARRLSARGAAAA